jgi:aminoglycoside phosphotransferase (APT) family kinase protein
VPIRTGVASGSYPFPWSVTAWFPGEPAVSRTGQVAHYAADEVAVALGAFLSALHQPAPPDAPENPFRGVPLAAREGIDAQNAAALRTSPGLAGDLAHLLELLDAGRAAPTWAGPPVWLQGDLHPANLLVHDGRLRAVIDFGDITAGDPATDLAVAWMLLPGGARGSFWSAYAQKALLVDDALVARARGWAAALALAFLAHSQDNPQMGAIGAATSAAVRDERTS